MIYILHLDFMFTTNQDDVVEDVYDRIEESDYIKLVEKRRSANNFVVDDSEF